MKWRWSGGAVAAYSILVLYVTAPVLRSGDALGIGDWDVHLFQHAAVFRSIYEYGQPPFWNPWYCGGNVLWQNPQAPLLTPAYLLGMIVSIPLAVKLTVAVHYVIGFAGMHFLLTRIIGARALPWVVMVASWFTLAGGIALHLAEGHVTFLPYFYLPWLLAFVITTVQTGGFRYAVGAAFVIGLSVLNGGVYVAVMSAVALGCFMALAAAFRREWRPLVMLALIGALAGCFAAPKLLPVLSFVGDPAVADIRFFPSRPDVMSRDMLSHSLLNPFQYRRMLFSGQNYGWHEYGNYFGAMGALLVAASFVWTLASAPLRREHWLHVSLALTAGVLFVIALGEFAGWAPATWLRRAPVLAQFRIPSRYLLVFTLFGAALVAAVVQTTRAEQIGTAEFRRLVAIAMMFATGFLAYRGSALFQGVFPYAPVREHFRLLARPPAPAFDMTTDGFGADSPMFRGLVASRGVVRCNEPLQLRGAIDPQRPVVFANAANVTVSRVAFSPNRITFRAMALHLPARVYLNERYIAGWSSPDATLRVDNESGLAYVELPRSAAASYTLRFVAPGLWPGLLLFAVACAASAVLWRRQYTPRAAGP